MHTIAVKDFRVKSTLIVGLIMTVVVLLAYSMLDSKRFQEIKYLEKRTTLQLNVEQERVNSWLKQIETVGSDFVDAEPLRTFVVSLSNNETIEKNKDYLEKEKTFVQTILDGFLYQNSLKRVSLITGAGDVFLFSGYSGELNKEQKQKVLEVIAKSKLEYLPVKQEGNELILEIFKPIYGFVVDDLPVAVIHMAVKLDRDFIDLITKDLPIEGTEEIRLWQNTKMGAQLIGFDYDTNSLKLSETQEFKEGFEFNHSTKEFLNTVNVAESPLNLTLIANEQDALAGFYTYARNLKVIVGLILISILGVVWGMFSKVVLKRYKTELKFKEKLEEQAERTVLSLVKTIELRDPYLAGHSSEVKDMAVSIANEMNLSAVDKTTLKYAAVLAGIGKIAIPKEILTKPTKLTAKEMKTLKSHVSYAEEILENIKFDFPVKEVVGQMYERLDGSGYPRGLHGTAINKLSRILAVCDVFCALCAPRSYREGKSPQEALEIMQNDIALFDAEVLSVLYKVINKRVMERK